MPEDDDAAPPLASGGPPADRSETAADARAVAEAVAAAELSAAGEIVLDVDPPPARPLSAPPRPGIAHLMLWTACWAVYLAGLRHLLPPDTEISGIVLPLAINGTVTSTAWLLLAIFVARRVRGMAWTIEPGEWLGAALGLRLTVQWLVYGLSLDLPHALIDLALCGFLATPLLLGALTRYWTRAFLAIVGIHALVVLFGSWLIAASTAAALLIPISIVAAPLLAALGERATLHNWLHYLGLATWLLHALLELWSVLGALDLT